MMIKRDYFVLLAIFFAVLIIAGAIILSVSSADRPEVLAAECRTSVDLAPAIQKVETSEAKVDLVFELKAVGDCPTGLRLIMQIGDTDPASAVNKWSGLEPTPTGPGLEVQINSSIVDETKVTDERTTENLEMVLADNGRSLVSSRDLTDDELEGLSGTLSIRVFSSHLPLLGLFGLGTVETKDKQTIETNLLQATKWTIFPKVTITTSEGEAPVLEEEETLPVTVTETQGGQTTTLPADQVSCLSADPEIVQIEAGCVLEAVDEGETAVTAVDVSTAANPVPAANLLTVTVEPKGAGKTKKTGANVGGWLKIGQTDNEGNFSELKVLMMTVGESQTLQLATTDTAGQTTSLPEVTRLVLRSLNDKIVRVESPRLKKPKKTASTEPQSLTLTAQKSGWTVVTVADRQAPRKGQSTGQSWYRSANVLVLVKLIGDQSGNEDKVVSWPSERTNVVGVVGVLNPTKGSPKKRLTPQANVSVTIKNTQTGQIVSQAKSDKRGRFYFGNLPAGRYVVTADSRFTRGYQAFSVPSREFQITDQKNLRKVWVVLKRCPVAIPGLC